MSDAREHTSDTDASDGNSKSSDDFAGTFEFAMGDFIAAFPCDLLYITNHMWARRIETSHSGAARFRFGLTAYAVRLLQDVYFLDWEVEPPTQLASRQQLGSIESKKAESDLFAPVAGILVALNEDVLSDPALINAEPYELGWMFEMQADSEDGLLTPKQYADHLVDAWDVAQKTIKGQANT